MKLQLVLPLAAIAFGLSSCSSTSEGARYTSHRISGKTQTITQTRTADAQVASVYGSVFDPTDPYRSHHYRPDIYTPYAYDHQGGAHDVYYRERAIRAAARANGRSGTVEVGRVTADSE